MFLIYIVFDPLLVIFRHISWDYRIVYEVPCVILIYHCGPSILASFVNTLSAGFVVFIHWLIKIIRLRFVSFTILFPFRDIKECYSLPFIDAFFFLFELVSVSSRVS